MWGDKSHKSSEREDDCSSERRVFDFYGRDDPGGYSNSVILGHLILPLCVYGGFFYYSGSRRRSCLRLSIASKALVSCEAFSQPDNIFLALCSFGISIAAIHKGNLSNI